MYGTRLLSGNVERFPGGLVFKAHRLLYPSTLSPRVTKKKKKVEAPEAGKNTVLALAIGHQVPPQFVRLMTQSQVVAQ